ncbi:prenylated flavin chaperone LpdD [Streptococcus caprae]|uniref:Amino acid decarboxylase n=1 Tax=Streptococcus caprae TaxID=1640501 RepID=A0ABV8CT91_9STRE
MEQTFTLTESGFQMEASAQFVGADLLIVLTGGSHPHIGTVTTYCKETADKQTTRFPSHSGRFHKDDVLADVILEAIVALLPQNATITSGIHVDGITKEQIQASFGMAQHLGQQIADWLQTISFDADKPTYYKK